MNNQKHDAVKKTFDLVTLNPTVVPEITVPNTQSLMIVRLGYCRLAAMLTIHIQLQSKFVSAQVLVVDMHVRFDCQIVGNTCTISSCPLTLLAGYSSKYKFC